jgi:hypothetical protein
MNNQARSLWNIDAKGEVPICSVSLSSSFQFSKMKLLIGPVFCTLVLGVSSQEWWSFLGQVVEAKADGRDMTSLE